MCKTRARIRSQKRSKREHPDDRGRLIMDAIYTSSQPEVQNFYRQVMKEEDMALKDQIRQGHTWSMDSYLDRIHMRMGKRFFHLLPPVMQKRFQKEYPLALIGAADISGLSTAV